MLRYLFSPSRSFHYATGMRLSRAYLFWTWTAPLHFIAANIEYHRSGYSLLVCLCLFNTVVPVASFIFEMYRQRHRLRND